ncbi:hypothetical protein CALVIDRAFT_431492 [Calocera viscosa TUFC12733]|uniref:Peptidase M16 N-terminal domain-containing protein n=1 Tax=Calocera viscosa (strain TUFC12733) TaxID=1330018 RepID=A0A167FZN5_CALVF|nr:hypothetical protein CALVIDRAFT_431492 [Calocera viscosa TUFC12733]
METTENTLSNGLRLIVLPDASNPQRPWTTGAITLNVGFLCPSVMPGIPHLVEHCCGDELNELLVTTFGGHMTDNTVTHKDTTTYGFEFPTGCCEEALKLVMGRIFGPNPTAEQVSSAIDKITGEFEYRSRNMSAEDARRRICEVMSGRAYCEGTAESLGSQQSSEGRCQLLKTMANVESFVFNYHRPGRAALVLRTSCAYSS